MMSTKMATPQAFLKNKFSKKAYDAIISAHAVTNTILLRDSNYNINLVMWPKFGYSLISVREVIITSILYGFDQKNCFSWGVVLVQAQ